MWWIKCKFSVKYEILLTNQEVDLYDIFMEQYLTASIHFKFRFHASTPTYHFIFSFTLFIPLHIPNVFELNSVAVTVWLSQLICYFTCSLAPLLFKEISNSIFLSAIKVGHQKNFKIGGLLLFVFDLKCFFCSVIAQLFSLCQTLSLIIVRSIVNIFPALLVTHKLRQTKCYKKIWRHFSDGGSVLPSKTLLLNGRQLNRPSEKAFKTEPQSNCW